MFQQRGDYRPELHYERGIGGILGDALYIYMARIPQMMLIAGVILMPASALAFIPSPSLALSAAATLIGGAAGTVLYAALVAAVGQSAVAGRIDVKGCYARVAWRGVSVLTFGTLYAAIFAAMVFPLEPFIAWSDEFAAFAESAGEAESEESAALAESPENAESPPAPAPPSPPATALLSLLALMAFWVCATVYMTTIVPSIIVEGRRGFGALRRGFWLARGSEWRILGHSIVYLTVFFAITVALALPFIIAGAILGDDEAFYVIGAASSAVVAQPILYIAATLLYFDIRLKKEGYDEARISEEMGRPTAQN